MRSSEELTPYQEASLGSVCAHNAKLALEDIECHRLKLAAARSELADLRRHSKQNDSVDDFEYIIQEYEAYIESTERAILQSEIDYGFAREQVAKHAGPGTLGGFVIDVLLQDDSSRPSC